MEQIRKYLALTLIFSFMIQPIWANQQMNNQQKNDSTSEDKGSVDTRYIIDPETGQLSMYIRVWGEVNDAGVKIVPSDTDLIALLGFFGGPTNYARLDNVRIIRYQPKQGEPKVVVANIEKFLETGDDSTIPQIYPNDTVVLKSSFMKVFREVTPYLTLALQIAQFAYYINIVRRN